MAVKVTWRTAEGAHAKTFDGDDVGVDPDFGGYRITKGAEPPGEFRLVALVPAINVESIEVIADK